MMTDTINDRIREEAYKLWRYRGCPLDDGTQHWYDTINHYQFILDARIASGDSGPGEFGYVVMTYGGPVDFLAMFNTY